MVDAEAKFSFFVLYGTYEKQDKNIVWEFFNYVLSREQVMLSSIEFFINGLKEFTLNFGHKLRSNQIFKFPS